MEGHIAYYVSKSKYLNARSSTKSIGIPITSATTISVDIYDVNHYECSSGRRCGIVETLAVAQVLFDTVDFSVVLAKCEGSSCYFIVSIKQTQHNMHRFTSNFHILLIWSFFVRKTASSHTIITFP